METRAGIDIGGTFTDVLAYDASGPIFHVKLPSEPTPTASFRAALAVLRRHTLRPDRILYSTTVATNALLEDTLPRIGLLVTAGFRHVFELNRPQADGRHDELGPTRVSRPLVPLECIHEVDERLDVHGAIRRPIVEEEATALADWCRERALKTVAVSLLHSYRNPESERRLKALLEAEDERLRVILSSDVLPELREYERTAATCLTAALQPLMVDHLHAAAAAMREAHLDGPLLVMQSSGGLQTVDNVGERPLATVLSGPAAAAVGVARLGAASGFSDLISFDMGGTSTDITLVRDGRPLLSTHGRLGGHPIKIPMIDITSIGAGGGSIVRLGADKRWHVGPLSAGATPGPVCYGNGGSEVTVTDANLLLGRLPTALLAGDVELFSEPAERALQHFGQGRRKTATDTAKDIVQLVNHAMCGAIRRLCTQRGLDPRASVLLAAGGAGPLHAADLAALLGVATVAVPYQPGFAAALGPLMADLRQDFSAAPPDTGSGLDADEISRILDGLQEQAAAGFDGARSFDTTQRFVRTGDFQYADMATQLTIALPPGQLTRDALQAAEARFHQAHERLCGFSFAGRKKVALSRLSVTKIGVLPKPDVPRRAAQDGPARPSARREVFFFESEMFMDCPVYRRTTLGAGAVLSGPAVVEQYDATTLIPPGWRADVDTYGCLVLTRTASG